MPLSVWLLPMFSFINLFFHRLEYTNFSVHVLSTNISRKIHSWIKIAQLNLPYSSIIHFSSDNFICHAFHSRIYVFETVFSHWNYDVEFSSSDDEVYESYWTESYWTEDEVAHGARSVVFDSKLARKKLGVFFKYFWPQF